MITFENISKQYGESCILDKASFAFSEHERTGLIGVNGSGKTTLLRMLGGDEEPGGGSIQKPSDLSIGYLPQEVEVLENKTPLDIVLEPFAHLLSFEEQLQQMGTANDPTEMRKAMQQMDALYTAMEMHDGYSLKARAESILTGLGIFQDKWLEPVQYLSGGYRMRAVLGRLLLSAPDYLLLDEPTNHLDMDSLIWLEKYLLRIRSGMLIVSHDRDFLNRITTTTAGIGSGTVTIYKGNYDEYMRMREENDATAVSRAKNISAKIAQNERFVERFKSKATKATQAQSRMKLIERLRAEMPTLPDAEQRSIAFSFPIPKPSGAVPLEIKNLSAGYNEHMVIQKLSLSINRGDKIAIVGPNGAGKSTLLKLLARALKPAEGSIIDGHNVVIRYFGQHQLEQLDPHKNLYETVMQDSVNTEKTFVRNILGAFLFSGNAVDKSVSVLSGGEKARLVLATILASPGNVLLLDEPTNHLDIGSVAMLADAMASFAGTIIFVSHDEFFVSKIANRIVEMRPGLVRDFPGSLANYRSYLETIFAQENEQNAAAPSSIAAAAPREKDTAPDKAARLLARDVRKKISRVIDKCEQTIAELEATIEQLDAQMHDPAYALHHELLHTTATKRAAAQEALDLQFATWETKQLELGQLGETSEKLLG